MPNKSENFINILQRGKKQNMATKLCIQNRMLN